MIKNRKICTCTTMVYTDGKISRYAVMVGPMKGRFFNANKAGIVAIYEIQGEPDYRAMTARHATEAAPAISWQA